MEVKYWHNKKTWRKKATTSMFRMYIDIFPAGIYLLKVNNRNTRTRCEICSKLTIKIPFWLNKLWMRKINCKRQYRQNKHCVKSVCIRSYSGLYSVRMQENTDQKNSKYALFSSSEIGEYQCVVFLKFCVLLFFRLNKLWMRKMSCKCEAAALSCWWYSTQV